MPAFVLKILGVKNMIYISRPAVETHKVVEKLADKSLDNHFKERRLIRPINEKQDEGFQGEFSRESLEEAVKSTNKIIFPDDRRFEFKVHERTGRMMVKLIDKETDEIVKELPPEKILDLVASIWDFVGILVDERG